MWKSKFRAGWKPVRDESQSLSESKDWSNQCWADTNVGPDSFLAGNQTRMKNHIGSKTKTLIVVVIGSHTDCILQ